MKRITLLATLTVLFVTGCSQSVGSRQPMPASTIPVVNHIRGCWSGYALSWNRSYDEYEACMDDPPISSTECMAERDAAEQRAYDGLHDCFLQLPMVDYSCIEQLQPDSREHDTDGDGVEDFWEYRMDLNPCEPCSYGGVPGESCDGDLDYDRDPANNADDDFPICGQIYIDGEWYPNPEGINDGRCV